jgi:acyl homoserine lactone synthase
MPKSYRIWEGSRFCVDASLPPEVRKRMIQEIIVGYLEFAFDQGVSNFVGVMYPAYWRNTLSAAAGMSNSLGTWQKRRRPQDRRGIGHCIEAALEKVRDRTGIRETLLNYGDNMEYRRSA